MRSARRISPCQPRLQRCGPHCRRHSPARRRNELRRTTMYNFEFHRPTGLRQASNMLGKLEEAKILAGGQTLIPTMKLRLASPDNLIDLNAIAGELSGIEVRGRSIVIGAMTRHADVANSADVKANIPALAYLAGLIGDPAVRHRGTLGGSLANNDPNSDYPAAALGLGATIHTTKGKHEADSFFKGLFETALAPDEIITKVSFPIAKKAGYEKFRNQASRFALVGVFVSKRGSEIRVAVTGAGSKDRKSTRLNSSHVRISYAVFCFKKKMISGHSS